MKKMKRIDAIIKGKASCLTDFLGRKSARILRNVESAIAQAEDEIETLNVKADSTISDLAGVAEASQTSSCATVLNRYIDTIKDVHAWEETLEILRSLKECLNEEVELKETEE